MIETHWGNLVLAATILLMVGWAGGWYLGRWLLEEQARMDEEAPQ